jgi:GNAT superfamily N-acetyltransferase
VAASPAGGSYVHAVGPEEFARLRAIELEADQMFLTVGIGPFTDDGSGGHLEDATIVLAAEDPPVGFASVGIVDGQAHLWQLAVSPTAGRLGHGTALVNAVCDWARAAGLGAVTLTTFRDVAWNGPFYARLGFRALTELSPGLGAIRDHERSIGDDDFGPRVAMRRGL